VVGDAFVVLVLGLVLVLVVVRVTILIVIFVIVAIIVVGVAICIICGSGRILYTSSPIIICGNTSVTRKILPNLLKLPSESLHLSLASSTFLITMPTATIIEFRSEQWFTLRCSIVFSTTSC